MLLRLAAAAFSALLACRADAQPPVRESVAGGAGALVCEPPLYALTPLRTAMRHSAFAGGQVSSGPPENQAPSANAGSDDSALVDESFALDASGSSDDGLPTSTLTYAWTKTAGSGTCTITDDEAETTTASCDAADTYVFEVEVCDSEPLCDDDTVTITVTAPSGGCSSGDPWPGYDNFCPDDVAAQVNSELGGSRGTTYTPTPPAIPVGTATPHDCDNEICVEDAALLSGHNAITLTDDIGAVGLHFGGVGWQDATVYLNGHSIEGVVGAHQAGNAARIAFIGPGWIKNVLFFGGSATVSDVIFHGVWIRRDDDAFNTFGSNGGLDLDRVSITGSIIGGYPAGGEGCATFLLGSGDDVVVADSNVEACPNSSGNNDTWAMRTSGQRVWVVDSQLQAHGPKHVVRFAAGSNTLYTTDVCVDQACRLILISADHGSMVGSVGDPDIDVDFAAQIRTSWFAGDSGSGVAWGPLPTTDFWYTGGTTICSESAASFDAGDLASPHNGTTALTDSLTYDGEPTSFTHANPVTGCTSFPSWPTRSADAITGIADSSVANVGSDPMGTPP